MNEQQHAPKGARRTRIGLAMMVKTPGVSAVKTRLAKDVGSAAAEAFYFCSVNVLSTTLECARIRCAAGVEVVGWPEDLGIELHPHFAVMEKSELKNPLWSKFPTLWQGEGGLGEKLDTVYSSLLSEFDGVIIIGSDLPHLGEHSVVSTAAALGSNPGVFQVGPTDDGGFFLFGGSTSLSREVWESVPYSSSQTCAALLKAIEPLGPVNLLCSQFDIDEGRDLARLQSNFGALLRHVPELQAFHQESWFHATAALRHRGIEDVP